MALSTYISIASKARSYELSDFGKLAFRQSSSKLFNWQCCVHHVFFPSYTQMSQMLRMELNVPFENQQLPC